MTRGLCAVFHARVFVFFFHILAVTYTNATMVLSNNINISSLFSSCNTRAAEDMEKHPVRIATRTYAHTLLLLSFHLPFSKRSLENQN